MEVSPSSQVVWETTGSIATRGSSINNTWSFRQRLNCFHFSCRKKCQSYPAGLYSQKIAKLRRKKTVFSHLISWKRKGISFEHAICHLSSDITGLWPMSLEDCQRKYITLVKKIKELEREDQGLLCKRELERPSLLNFQSVSQPYMIQCSFPF
jgi:hypothetical protein